MTSNSYPPPSPEMLERLQSAANKAGHLAVFDFVKEALFSPEIGYYSRAGKRVGKTEDSDFYTAESLGSTFSKLLSTSLSNRFPQLPANSHFIELGEKQEALQGEALGNRFENRVRLGIFDPKVIPSPALLFLHEVLDAQPFDRFIFSGNKWMEVAIDCTSTPFQPILRTPTRELPKELTPNFPEGYTVDFPSGSIELLSQLTQETWSGGIVIFDYGMPLETMLAQRPNGTGRTYYRHQQGDVIWESPGDVDITHHLAWEPLETVLRSAGFNQISLQTQEGFFVQNAQNEIGKILETAGSGLNPEKQELIALLHPQHFGAKFQVLSAYRE